MIQEYNFEEDDYRGERFADWHSDVKGNNNLLVLSQPNIIYDIHCAYLNAGADIIETNTFNATPISMADYNMQGLLKEINIEARKSADKFSAQTPNKTRLVCRILGPTSRTASISPDVNNPAKCSVTFDELVAAYVEATY